MRLIGIASSLDRAVAIPLDGHAHLRGLTEVDPLRLGSSSWLLLRLSR